jgi:hypothetical protein
MPDLALTFPGRLINPLNATVPRGRHRRLSSQPAPRSTRRRLHWSERLAYCAAWGRTVAALWRAQRETPAARALLGHLSRHGTVQVTLVPRLPRRMDADGIVAALKPVRDALAREWLGGRLGERDDDPRLDWRYGDALIIGARPRGAASPQTVEPGVEICVVW